MDRDDLTDRTERTTRALHRAALDAGMMMTGDLRVGEPDAAALLGLSATYMKQLRHEGRGPAAYGLGFAGGRVSYRLHDIGTFIELRREIFDADVG